MWRIFDSRDVAFEPYSKGMADIKRVLRQKSEEGRFEGFGFIRLPSKGVFPKHAHPEREEIYYVISGSGILMVGDEALTVSEGKVIRISGDVSHGLSNPTDEPFEVLYVTAFA